MFWPQIDFGRGLTGEACVPPDLPGAPGAEKLPKKPAPEAALEIFDVWE